MITLSSSSTVLGVALLAALGYVSTAVYTARLKIYRLKQRGLPMVSGWNWILGHLLASKSYMDQLPHDAHVDAMIRDMAKEFTKTDMFYVDFWPFVPPMLVVNNLATATQVTTKLNLPRPKLFHKYFLPLAGGPNLFTMNGEEWKAWRAIFNPGFSATAMLNQVPHIIDAVEVFCDILSEKAQQNVMFSLDDLCSRLTIEIILSVSLDMNSDYQRVDVPLATALRSQIAWHSFGHDINPFKRWNLIRKLVQKRNSRIMNQAIHKHLVKRFEEMKQQQASKNTLTTTKISSHKSIIMLALDSYMASSGNKTIQDVPTLDPNFSFYATAQIRLFLFAGSDSTASSLVYTYHLLSKHPQVLAMLRQEHNHIFGPNPVDAGTLLKENPSMLNKASYTLAVIKESLRLFPAAACMRSGISGVSLTDAEGREYPTDDVYVWIVHQALHYNPRIWQRASEFLPERWTVDPDHELYPPSNGAFRTFEHGPRNCIGQTMVLTELRVALVMTARKFDFKPAYEEWDAMQDAKTSWGTALLGKLGIRPEQPIRTVDGERAYQIEKGGAHPADGYPCRVSLVKL